MKKYFKHLGLSLAVACLGLTIFILAKNHFLFAAEQLKESSSYTPTACFQTTTQAGMKNANESVMFGTKNGESDLGATFDFDARCTKDKDTDMKDLQFIWDFGDGNEEYAYANGNYLTEHIYFKEGAYIATLLVYDPEGNKSYYKLNLKVVKDTGPHINVTISPESGTFNQEFTFDPTGTYHNQFKDTYLEYRWDFNGDKTVEIDWTKQKKAKYTYPFGSTGTKTVFLEVKDPAGYTKTAELSIMLVKNTPPQLNLLVIPDTIGTFDTNFIIDSTSSKDDQSTFKCRIDSQYDGKEDIIYDNDFSSNCYWIKKYSKVGTRNIKIQIEDKDGERSEQAISLSIDESAPYFQYLKSKYVVQGFNYKMYKIQDSNNEIKILPESELQNEKILKTYWINGDMGIERNATRAELVKMVLTAFGISTGGVSSKDILFADISPKDWYYRYLIKAYQLNILKGYQQCNAKNECITYAKPNDPITRGEALAVIFRASNFELLNDGQATFRDVPKDHWAFSYVDTAYTYDFIDPESNKIFGVNKAIKRGEIAEILYKILNNDLKSN